MEAQAVFHCTPQSVEIRKTNIAPLTADQVLIKSRYSAISGGTETMIFRGFFPQDAQLDVKIESLNERFVYPFRYGYALVGIIIDTAKTVSNEWIGRQVFAFHPHQDYASVSLKNCLPIPDSVSELDALFLANMESSVNFVMDANPNLGEQMMVFGQGVVGLLSTALLAQFPLRRLIAVDPLKHRRQHAIAWGAMEAIDPTNSGEWDRLKNFLSQQSEDSEIDTVLELSGNPLAMSQAIEMTGFGGRIIVGSWYGTNAVALNLGRHFHRRRISIISSQVSTLNPQLSGRWPKTRRLATAWEWIKRLHPEKLITHRFSLANCQQAFTVVSEASDNAMQVIFEYPD